MKRHVALAPNSLSAATTWANLYYECFFFFLNGHRRCIDQVQKFKLDSLTASVRLVLLLFSCTIPLISPMCPEPMAKSLSFQSFDNSLSMLGASV